jgi:hypothetical protein
VADLLLRVSDTNNLRYLAANLGPQDIDGRAAHHFDLQVIGKDLNPLHAVLYEDASLVFDGLRSLCDSTTPMAIVP